MNELALFAGAGGGILGGHLLGWRTVCAVEREPYAASVLVARQNDGLLAPFPVWDDVCTFDGHPWRGIVDVVSGGFPCQDISAAGKGAGIGGGRSGLWKEMARIIGEVRPRFAFVENSPMLTTRGLGTVLGDLAALGFDAEWGVLSAADVGAPHLRERIWILANANSKYCGAFRTSCVETGAATTAHPASEQQAFMADAISHGRPARRRDDREHDRTIIGAGSEHDGQIGADVAHAASHGVRELSECEQGQKWRKQRDSVNFNRNSEDVPDPLCNRPQGVGQDRHVERQVGLCGGARGDQEQHLRDTASAGFPHGRNQPLGQPGQIEELERPDWWATEPDVGRVAHGVAARVDRLKAIGNGQVSLCAARAFALLRGRVEA